MRMWLILVVGLGALFFLGAKRRFDLFSVAFASSVLYFLPGLLGYVLLPRTDAHPIRDPMPLASESYVVMTVVVLGIVLGAWVNDRIGVRGEVSGPGLEGSEWVPMIATVVSVVALVISVRQVGSTLFLAEKAEVLEALGRWHILFENAAMVAAATAWGHRRPRAGATAFALLLTSLYIGFRFPLALAFLACLLLWGRQRGPQRFGFTSWRIGVLGASSVMFLFAYKGVYQLLRQGRWDLISMRLGDPDYYMDRVLGAEPFTIQATLDQVIRQDWHVGYGHLAGLRRSLVVFAPEAGWREPSFGQLSRAHLFPDAIGGTASNIWAEAWSTGGWPFLILFLVFWLGVLGFLNRFVGMRDPSLGSTAALVGGAWAFYVHRNDLQFQITMTRRLIAVAVGATILAMVVQAMARARPPREGPT